MKIHDKYLQREGIQTRNGAMAKQPGRYELDKESLQHHLNHGSYSILSAGNPNAQKLDDKENAKRHADLQKELVAHGAIFHEGKGVYGGHSEPVIMVHHRGNVTPELIEKLGNKYGQESVFHSNANNHELKYVTGAQAGHYHTGKGHEFGDSFDDNFTDIPASGKFQGNLDFDTVHKSSHKELMHYEFPLAYGKKAKVKHIVNTNHFYN
jgi:hypothetical protein